VKTQWANALTLSRRTLLATGAAGALASNPIARAVSKLTSPSLNRTLDALAYALADFSPEIATFLGLDTGSRADLSSRLDHRNEAANREQLSILKRYRQQISHIDDPHLMPAQRLLKESALYAVDLAIEGARHPYGNYSFLATMQTAWRPYWVSQQSGAALEIPDFLDTKHRVETRTGAEAYLSRLRALPRVLTEEDGAIQSDAAKGVIPPRFILDKAIAQISSLRAPNPQEHPLVQSLVRKASSAHVTGDWQRPAANIVGREIYPALERQVALLKQIRTRATDDAGVWKFPDGESYYQWTLKVGTTTNLSPEEIHRTGVEQVAEISSQMDTILKGQGLTEGGVGERALQLAKDPRSLFPSTDAGRNEILDYLNSLVAQMRARLPHFSKLRMKADVLIKRVAPEIEEGAPLAYMNPGSLDGSRPSIYYINLKDITNWAKWQLPTLVAHETIPGHVWQGAYVTEHHSELPVLSAMMGFNGFVEGWALYTEQLVDEDGFYAGDPLGRLGYLQGQQFRAARLVVDTGLHSKRWTRNQAIRWMMEQTGRGQGGISSEVDRYCAAPGQACGYKIGHNEMVRLRQSAKLRLGKRFDVRDYNDLIVETAGVPLAVLSKRVDSFVEDQHP
jgi:uncharacterized protein (DUF885 family)